MYLFFLKFYIGLFIILVSVTSYAGEQLTVQELINKSEAIALVKVDFRTKKVELIQWLKKESQEDSKENLKFLDLKPSICLPNQTELQRWVLRYGKQRDRKQALDLWQQAIKSQQYQSLIFLKWLPDQNIYKPVCETEVLLVKQWQAHPEFKTYLSRVNQLIAKTH